MTDEKQKTSLIKKSGKWAGILSAAWIGLNIVIPLALLRIPAFQRYLVALKEKLPLDINGFG